MSEQKSILYTPWTRLEGSYEACRECMKTGNKSYGILLRRTVTGRDKETYREYKIQCPMCKRSTDIHRHKLLTMKEWEGRQEYQEELPHRNKKKETGNG